MLGLRKAEAFNLQRCPNQLHIYKVQDGGRGERDGCQLMHLGEADSWDFTLNRALIWADAVLWPFPAFRGEVPTPSPQAAL